MKIKILKVMCKNSAYFLHLSMNDNEKGIFSQTMYNPKTKTHVSGDLISKELILSALEKKEGIINADTINW